MKKTHGIFGLAVLLVIFFSMMALMRFAASDVQRLSGGQGIIDLTFGISPSRISAALSAYGRRAALYYQWVFYSVDMVYAFAYVSFYRCSIKSIVERCEISGRAGELLPVVPVIGMIADLLENTAMFVLLSGSRSPVLMWAFTVLNIIKFVFVYSSLAIVLGGVICLIKKRLS